MCTDGRPYAERAIRFGGEFARSLDANVTVLHIGPTLSPDKRNTLTRTRKTLSEWKKDLAGTGYLDQAGKILEEMGLVRSQPIPSPTARYIFRNTPEGSLEFHPVGQGAKRVRLLLREGNAAEEILDEAQMGKYDLIISGARGHEGEARYFVGSTAIRVAEFATCSVLIAKNIKEQHHFLICTDGSKQAEQAEIFGATIAQALSARVTVLSISQDQKDLSSARERVRRADMVLSQLGIQIDVETRVGRPSEEIIKEAKDHDVVVMGASGSSAVRRFFLGSVPLKVIEYGECPVLLVRGKAA